MNLVLCGQGISKLILLYESLIARGAPPAPKSVRKFKDVFIAKVFPFDFFDFFFSGFGGQKGEIWLAPGCAVEQEKQPGAQGHAKLCGILGPGNIEGFQEPFEQLFVQGNVCIFKSNPVNAILTDEIYPIVFKSLIDLGYIGFASGGAEIGEFICNHEKVEALHMVGACDTYDKIVWGPPNEQPKRKAENDKKIKKPFLAELGAVTPWVVVPGDWSQVELEAQVKRLVGTKVMNTGHACSSPQVVVLDKSWPYCSLFVERCRNHFLNLPNMPAYYQGVGKRLESFKSHDTEVLHEDRGPDGLRVFFIPDIDQNAGARKAIREEAFGPVIAFKFISGENDPRIFLRKAVSFCNEEVFGSLSINITISPETQKTLDLDSFIYDLRWGSIAINMYAGVVNAIPTLRWGALPGRHAETDIQSGQGSEMNVLLLRNAAKSVVYGPFMDPFPVIGALPEGRSPYVWRALGFATVSNSVLEFFKLPLSLMLPESILALLLSK